MPASGKPINRNIILSLILSFLALIPSLLSGQQSVESVFSTSRSNPSGWQAYTSPVNTLYRQIMYEAKLLLSERTKNIDTLKTVTDWVNYRQNLRQKIYSGLKEFKRTPLNPEVTGKIDFNHCIIEKIVFQSFPQFYVTGCLFIPKERQKPAPAVIYCSGHNETGFRNETYLKVILNLVQKGFVVFAYDPVGQGERLQYPGENGKSLIGGPTSEHSFAGIQTLLTGHSLSDYFIWDGVRAVDYLLTRPEVDAARIGITGRSGGGTQSAMIAAYDERIYAAAPECYITAFRRLFESMGPQDAEQNPFNAISKGFDHADFFHLRAPKPSLMVTTTNDIFSIQGAHDVYKEACRSYVAFSKSENMSMAEDFGVHESTLKNREAVYAFFLKHLNIQENPSESVVELPDISLLKVTSTGQVASSYPSKTVFDLNKSSVPVNNNSVPKKETTLQKIREVTGDISGSMPEDFVYTGKIKKEDYSIEKYFIRGEKKQYALPFFLIKSPTADNKKLIVLLSPDGKGMINKHDTIISKLARLGFSILCPDLPGTGELSLTDFRGDSFVKGKSYNHFFGANLIGRSIAGIQASDLSMLLATIKKEYNQNNSSITVISEKEMCIPLLLWALSNESLNGLILVQPLSTYRSLAETRMYDPGWMMASMPGALKLFDLPLLEASLVPVPLTLINPVDGSGVGLTDFKPFNIVKEAFRNKNFPGNFQILQMNDADVWDYIYQKIANSSI